MVSAEGEDENVCANCGIAGVDEIKLEECDGCDLVKYCSDKCREEHREQHSEECKRRADKLHDKRLFTQPDISHLGECPICFLPLPLDPDKSSFNSCCGKTICIGCTHENLLQKFLSGIRDEVKASRCLFCRTPASDKEEYEKREMERIEANDPAVLSIKGNECYNEGNYDEALKYLIKAAELGDAEAQFRLGVVYYEGDVVEKDQEKGGYHWEKAAIGGHPYARFNLGYDEAKNGNTERAVKHFIIAANLGHEASMKALLMFYKDGDNITKEEYGATLRTHQAAIDATKSSQREVAERRQARIQQEKDRKNRSK